MTLGEFLNINGDEDMPVLILGYAPSTEEYVVAGNFGDHGIFDCGTVLEVATEESLALDVDYAVDMKVDGIEGYVIWVSHHD